MDLGLGLADSNFQQSLLGMDKVGFGWLSVGGKGQDGTVD